MLAPVRREYATAQLSPGGCSPSKRVAICVISPGRVSSRSCMARNWVTLRSQDTGAVFFSVAEAVSRGRRRSDTASHFPDDGPFLSLNR